MYYSEMTLEEALEIVGGLLFDTDKSPKCEYRSPQFDGGTQQGRLIQCRNKAAMWTDRGLRCEDHKGD